MRIDGVSMYVNDIEKERSFFETYFSGKVVEEEENSAYGRKSCCILFSQGTRLELLKCRRINEISMQQYLGYKHMAFRVKKRSDVISITGQVHEDGYEVIAEPHREKNRYVSRIMDGEGNIIEITT